MRDTCTISKAYTNFCSCRELDLIDDVVVSIEADTAVEDACDVRSVSLVPPAVADDLTGPIIK